MEAQRNRDSGSERYGAKVYQFSPDFLNQVQKLNPVYTLFDFMFSWVGILSVGLIGKYLWHNGDWFWATYIPLGFLMAGRQGALLQLVHEASHRLLSHNLKINNFLGSWLCAFPIGLTLDGYTKGHMQHHAGTNTIDDLPTDMEKYSQVDFKTWKLYRLFLFDVTGWTALRSFLGHNYKSLTARSQPGSENSKFLKKIAGLMVAQAVILGIIFQFDLITYILLWIVPLISFNMVLLRFRGIAEHGRSLQEGVLIDRPDQGNMYTRTVELSGFVGGVERILIGSLNANFHHEHHILPKVPHYHLSKVHDLKREEIQKRAPGTYVPSYFRAALFGSGIRSL